MHHSSFSLYRFLAIKTKPVHRSGRLHFFNTETWLKATASTWWHHPWNGKDVAYARGILVSVATRKLTTVGMISIPPILIMQKQGQALQPE